MKHTYLMILSLLLITTGAIAQKRTLTIPVHNYPDSYMESMSQNHVENPDIEAVTIRPLSEVVSHIRGGGALWSEDFEGGFPAGWVADDQSGICPWKWSMNGSHGNFNGSNAGDYADPISSTTGGNGFLIVDPDSANHFTYGQPSGSTYQYLESYFATTQIDLGASYSSLLLEFEQNFRFNNSLDLIVQVSADSTNWIDYTVQGGVDNNDGSADPDLVSINISAAIGNSTTAYLRIGWNARVYHWMIDDMQIVEGLNYDLEFTKAYHGDVILDYQYSKMPLEQATEMVIGAAVTNLGGVTQSGVSVAYDILQDGSSVSTGTFDFNEDIIAADTDTAWHSTGYTPDATGDYEVTMTVSSDSTDENSSNQSGSSEFEVTGFVFAHDYDETYDIQVYGQDDSNGDANPYGHGNVFIPSNGGSAVYALEAAFGSNTTTGTSIIAEVHELGISIQDIVDSYQTVFDITPDHVNGGSPFFFTTITLAEEVALTAGTGYTIALQSEGVDDELWLLSNTGDEDYSTALYGPYGTGGATNWYNGWNHTPGLRMNINPDIVGIEEMMAETGFGIYPNPATDQVTIVFADNVDYQSITLVDLGGRIIKQLDDSYSSNSLKVTMTTEGIASGAYFINVLSRTGVSTQRLIIE
jgi:hypothetical protein